MTELNDRYRDLRRKIDAAVCTRYARGLRWEHPYCDKFNNEEELESLQSVAILSLRWILTNR